MVLSLNITSVCALIDTLRVNLYGIKSGASRTFLYFNFNTLLRANLHVV